MSRPVTSDLIEVFRSPDRAQCDDRVFMLSALGISGEIGFGTNGYVVRVPHRQGAFAAHHLWQYELELRRRAAALQPLPPARIHPHAWLGSVLYAAVLVLVAVAIIQGWWGEDAFARGALDAGQVQRGQWWRAFTALTLHLDIVHLVMNLGAGAAIGYFAARQIGTGSAWLLTVLGAGLANLAEGLLGAPSHQSVGASTAVFTALGLLAAHSWRTRGAGPQSRAQSWARQWAPLVAGVVLLGLLGSGGGEEAIDRGTNLVAHAFGFVAGVLFGWIAARGMVAQAMLRMPQWAAGLGTIAILSIAWGLALAQ